MGKNWISVLGRMGFSYWGELDCFNGENWISLWGKIGFIICVIAHFMHVKTVVESGRGFLTN